MASETAAGGSVWVTCGQSGQMGSLDNDSEIRPYKHTSSMLTAIGFHPNGEKQSNGACMKGLWLIGIIWGWTGCMVA